MKKLSQLIYLFICMPAIVIGQIAENFPDQTWMQYSSPEMAGFSSRKLDSVRQYFDESDGAGLLVIYRGRVAYAAGETNRRFRCASIRKSFLNALYGIYADKGQIDTSSTLAELQIDDIHKLTPVEKQATVYDLLTARSGIYLPATYSPRGMIKNLPARGSHPPGSYWFYNNWDFNTLGTIFENATDKDIFKTFKDEIAEVIGMQDFELRHTYSREEPEKSRHAAYIFRMTARDMARFGLLYLNKGRWQNQQIIPEAWVEKSTTAISAAHGNHVDHGAYGMLWWVSASTQHKYFFASGSGGQRIIVLPENEMVIVHVVDTYDNNAVSQSQIKRLIDMIVSAKDAPESKDATLKPYSPSESTIPKVMTLDKAEIEKYCGTYQHRFLGELKIIPDEGKMLLQTGIGAFKLYPVSTAQFIPEDIRTPIMFQQSGSMNQKRAKSIFNHLRKVEKVVFYY